MLKSNKVIRVLLNDTRTSLPNSSEIAQGGLSIFVNKINNYFDKINNRVELISLIFSHNNKDNNIYIKKTKGNHSFYELIYPISERIKTYKRNITKKEYVKFLEPFIKKVEDIFEESKPNLVFLNGFPSLNWIIMEAAYRKKIPVCIQHAGLLKKELSASPNNFSPSVLKIFSKFEKETYKKTNHQIFLNEFSRDVFFSIHNIKKNKRNYAKTSIIPLPIEVNDFEDMNIKEKQKYNIGVVARWDGVKNHDAVLRFSKYIKKNKANILLNVVTALNPKHITEYGKEYTSSVNIVNPMTQKKLKSFYKSQDVILIPSRFDVSPTVLMEAISCGKPVIISSNVGWVSDYRKFGLEDLIISPQASGKIINDTIFKLINNKDKYLTKFKKLQKKIINKHNPKIVFEQYFNIFKKLK